MDNELRLAFLFLTRLPVGRIEGEAPPLTASAWAWPLVGLALGLGAALIYGLATGFGLPPLLAAALSVMALVLMTGGLHEDGLADTADGLGAGRDRDRTLEIMRDSRIGSYGALALGFSVLIRVAGIAALSRSDALWALPGLAMASRALMPWALCHMPAARPDGLGRGANGVRRETALLALAIGFAALLPFGLWAAVVTALAMAGAAAALGALAMKRIGGQTGDICGAMQQVSEMAGWCALAALV